MANLIPKRVKLSGLDPAYTAADAAGDIIPTSDHVFLHVKNAHATVACTVTVLTPGNTQFGVAQPDVTVVVPALGERLIGPLPSDLHDKAFKGVKVTYSVVTSVTRSAITI